MHRDACMRMSAAHKPHSSTHRVICKNCDLCGHADMHMLRPACFPLPTLRRPIGVGMEDLPPDVELDRNKGSEIDFDLDFPPDVVREGPDTFPHDVIVGGSSGSGSQAPTISDGDVMAWVKKIYRVIADNHLVNKFKKIRVMIDCLRFWLQSSPSSYSISWASSSSWWV